MTEDMTMTMSPEDDLRALLQERAEMARISPDAAAVVRARIEQRRRGTSRRRIAIAVAAGASVLGGLWSQVGGPVLVTADGSDRRPGLERTAPETTVPADVAGVQFPRLALARPGLTVEHVEEYTSSADVDRPGEVFTQVFRGADGRVAGPALVVRTVAAGVAYGIGEEASGGDVRRVDINGSTGFLVHEDSLSPSLGWRLADGRGVHLKAIGMPGQALLDIAQGMRLRSGRAGWDLPLSAMPQTVEGEVRYGGSRSSELQYAAADGGRVAVRVFEGDRLRFEDLLLDRADAASAYEPVTIRGIDGVMFSTGDGHLAVAHADGIIIELALPSDRDAALATVASLEEVSEAEWQAMRQA